MWELYRRAERWGQPPSSLMGIDNQFLAWCLDEAVDTFGTTVESRVRQAGKSTGKSDTEKMQESRARRCLERHLGITPSFRSVGG